MIELTPNLAAVYDGMRAHIKPDDFACLHVWRQIITSDGKFTNFGAAVIWASLASRAIQAPDTPQARQDDRFHERERTASWLP